MTPLILSASTPNLVQPPRITTVEVTLGLVLDEFCTKRASQPAITTCNQSCSCQTHPLQHHTRTPIYYQVCARCPPARRPNAATAKLGHTAASRAPPELNQVAPGNAASSENSPKHATPRRIISSPRLSLAHPPVPRLPLARHRLHPLPHQSLSPASVHQCTSPAHSARSDS